MRGRVLPYVAGAAVVVAMLGPPLRGIDRDSYPLSTYPMFSHDRGRTSRVATVVGYDEAGSLHRLSPHLVGGSDEVMLAVETAGKAVARGPEATEELCEQVAARVATDRDLDDLTTVAVIVEEHDAVAWFAERDREPRSVDERATCEVRR